jgi:hypothetical protein
MVACAWLLPLGFAFAAEPSPRAETVPPEATAALPAPGWRVDLALTGNYFSGNLDQAQLLGRVHLRTSGPRGGADVLASGFRVWSRMADAPYQRVGDDLSGVLLPFVYVRPKLYLQGYAGFGSSLSRQVEGRVNAGGAVGVTPVRTADVLVRGSVGMQVERAAYASDRFNLDGVQVDGTTRTVPRAVVASNGWYRVKRAPVSLRYLAWAMVNPAQWRDYRSFLDLGLDVRVAEGWSARASVTAAHDSLVPIGVSPAEVRAGIGIAYSTP